MRLIRDRDYRSLQNAIASNTNSIRLLTDALELVGKYLDMLDERTKNG